QYAAQIQCKDQFRIVVVVIVEQVKVFGRQGKAAGIDDVIRVSDDAAHVFCREIRRSVRVAVNGGIQVQFGQKAPHGGLCHPTRTPVGIDNIYYGQELTVDIVDGVLSAQDLRGFGTRFLLEYKSPAIQHQHVQIRA